MKKCFIEYLDGTTLRTAEIDTNASILFTAGGFIEYETPTESIQDDAKNIVRIYFK